MIKDNGGIKKYDSGYQRGEDENKVKYMLTQSGPMFDRWAEHLTEGATKYGENNWMLAHTQEELDRFTESAFRHFIQWLRGETDEDHAAALFFNINGAEYVKDRMVDSLGPTIDEMIRLHRGSKVDPHTVHSVCQVGEFYRDPDDGVLWQRLHDHSEPNEYGTIWHWFNCTANGCDDESQTTAL